MSDCAGAGPYSDHCDGCNDENVDELRRVVDRLESVHAAVEAQLALNHPEPELVTDATTGRYVLLDALIALVTARIALLGATR